ncbi:MAG: hypothetical protein J5518_11250 [Lachnospiraceae bacterium]|nr:hypothetical protein [Lachnospiraceae bacterium]
MDELTRVVEEHIKKPTGVTLDADVKLKEDLMMDSFSLIILFRDLEVKCGRDLDPVLLGKVRTIGDLYHLLTIEGSSDE